MTEGQFLDNFVSMPKVTVNSKSAKTQAEAFEVVKDFISNDPDLKKLDPSYKVDFNESNHSGQAKGKQFSAQLRVSGDGDGSSVEIVVDLPFMLSPFKGKIQSSLKEKLDNALA